MFSGSLTALVTPFRGGEIDHAALGELVEAQIAGGVHGLVPCGSTGESATLTHEEHIEVVQAVVRLARGRVPGDRRHRLQLDGRGDPADARAPRRPAPTARS